MAIGYANNYFGICTCTLVMDFLKTVLISRYQIALPMYFGFSFPDVDERINLSWTKTNSALDILLKITLHGSLNFSFLSRGCRQMYESSKEEVSFADVHVFYTNFRYHSSIVRYSLGTISVNSKSNVLALFKNSSHTQNELR